MNDAKSLEVVSDEGNRRMCVQCNAVPAPTGMCAKCEAFVYDPVYIYDEYKHLRPTEPDARDDERR